MVTERQLLVDVANMQFENNGVWKKENREGGAVIYKPDGKTPGNFLLAKFEFKKGRQYLLRYNLQYKTNRDRIEIFVFRDKTHNQPIKRLSEADSSVGEISFRAGANYDHLMFSSFWFTGDDAFLLLNSLEIIELNITHSYYYNLVSSIEADGYSVLQYIADTFEGKIYIFTDERHFPLFRKLWTQYKFFSMESKHIDLRFVMSRRTTIPHGLFIIAEWDFVFESIDIVDIGKQDTFIILTDDCDEYVFRYAKLKTNRVIKMQYLLKNAINTTRHDRVVKNFICNHPNVFTILVDMKIYAPNPTPFVQMMQREKINMGRFMQMAKNNADFDKSILGYQSDISCGDIYNAFVSPPSTVLPNGRRVFDDYKTNSVNCQNGMRVTADNPDNPARTIWMIGGCRMFGIGSPDCQTPASFLQKTLNEYGYNIAVINAAQTLLGEMRFFGYNLNSLPVQPGDIVIIDGHPTQDFSDCDTIKVDLQHLYGEAFLANDGHFSPNGNHEIADAIFAHLNKNNYCRLLPPPPPPSSTHTHYALYNYGIPSWANALYGNSAKQSDEYGKDLADFKASLSEFRLPIGAIVMNCNPFTLGHRYLIEYAASRVTHLYIFAVEEDRSIFPFSDRYDLIKAGTADLPNVTVLPSGKFIISSLTFSDYFNKSEIQDREIDPSQDVELFANHIAPTLGITVRFAGEEPLDKVTLQYNQTMARILPQHGINFEVIPRKESDGSVISASRVRALLKDKNFEAIKKIVPQSTYKYLVEKYGGKE